MKIVQYTDLPPKTLDADGVKGVQARLAIGKSDGASNFCMRVFELEKGGYTPRHTHEWEHEIFVHEGQGQVFQDGGWVDLEKGSVLFIPGMQEHQIKNTGDSKLVFICLIPAGPDEI